MSANASKSRVAAQARRLQGAQTRLGELQNAGQGDHAHRLVEARQRDRPDRRCDLAAEPAGGDQHHALGALGELVGELHGDTAAEAVPDDGHLVDAEDREQVSHTVRVAAQAVVGARLVRLAVPEEIGRDDGVAARELVDDRVPGGVITGQAVQQQQHRTRALLDERTSMSVDGDVLDVWCWAWRGCLPGVPTCNGSHDSDICQGDKRAFPYLRRVSRAARSIRSAELRWRYGAPGQASPRAARRADHQGGRACSPPPRSPGWTRRCPGSATCRRSPGPSWA